MQAYHFAAAKDGEMYVSGCDAETYEDALDMALGMVAEHFGMDGQITESDLGGFQLWAAASFEYC